MEKIPKGKNVAEKGEDISVGEKLVERGQILNSQNVAMLIGIEKERIKVFAVPKVGIMSIGNELRTLQDPIKEGSVVNNYAHLTSGFLTALGAHPILLGIAKDNQEEIAAVVQKGVEECDMVITIAGSSVGARDFTPNAILSLKDSSMMFHGLKSGANQTRGPRAGQQQASHYCTGPRSFCHAYFLCPSFAYP